MVVVVEVQLPSEVHNVEKLKRLIYFVSFFGRSKITRRKEKIALYFDQIGLNGFNHLLWIDYFT